MRSPLRRVNRRIDWWGMGSYDAPTIHKECPMSFDFSMTTQFMDSGCPLFSTGGDSPFTFDSTYFSMSTTEEIFDQA